MKSGKLRIGVKGGAKVVVPIQEPETIDDVNTLSRGNLAVVLRCYTRGWRIENQERSGARDEVRDKKNASLDGEALTKLIAEKVQNYDPTAVAARGPKTPKVIKLAVKKGQKLTTEQLSEMLAAQGINVELAE
jgi:hypothetical protein